MLKIRGLAGKIEKDFLFIGKTVRIVVRFS